MMGEGRKEKIKQQDKIKKADCKKTKDKKKKGGPAQVKRKAKCLPLAQEAGPIWHPKRCLSTKN